MGKRKERRLAAMLNAGGRRVKLDLFAEPSGEAGSTSLNDEGGGNIDQNHHAGGSTSPSSSDQKQENPLLLLGQYSDEELDEQAGEPPKHADEASSLSDSVDQVEHVEASGNVQCSNDKAIAGGVEESDNLGANNITEANDAKVENISSVAVQCSETDSLTLSHAPDASELQINGDVTDGWKMVMDEQSNQYYYWNTVTGETSWEVPSSLALEAEKVSAHAEKVESGHAHSSVQLNNSSLAYASVPAENVIGYESSVNGDAAHLTYDVNQSLTNYSAVVNGISYGEAPIFPSIDSFQQSHSLLPENLTENKDIHVSSYDESSEAADSYSMRLVHYGDLLLQRLKTLKRSGDHMATDQSISKEIEIRISDCKALSSYGSSLLPFWWHTETQLKQLESAIGKEGSQLFTTKSLDDQSRQTNSAPSETLGAKTEVDGREKRIASPIENGNSPSRHVSMERRIDANNMQESDSTNIEQASPGFTMDLAGKVQPHAEDVDMDVEMEVDDGTLPAPITEVPTPSEQLMQPSFSSTEFSNVPSDDFSVPPPPAEEEWIPPPPPEDEPIPPPPPEEPALPPTLPPVPEAFPPQPYEGQYNTVPTYGYYAPTSNEVGNNHYYVPIEGSHIVEQHAQPYYEAVAVSTFPQLTADGSLVESAVYYDVSTATIPTGPAASGAESYMYCVEPGSVNYPSNATLLDHTGKAVSTTSSGCSSSLSTKARTNKSAIVSGPYTVTEPSVPAVSNIKASSMNGTTVDAASAAVSKKNQSKVVRSKKRALAVAPISRPSKKVSSLVDKWKAAKEELHGEEDEEPENAYEVLERKRQKEIEEWRSHQIASGEAQDNANFVPLGGDWRERVRQKKAAAKPEAAQAKSEAAESPSVLVETETKMPDLVELSKGLPSGWQAYWDESTKGVYYGNTITSETTWDRPTG